jgi:hypothetical protein
LVVAAALVAVAAVGGVAVMAMSGGDSNGDTGATATSAPELATTTSPVVTTARPESTTSPSPTATTATTPASAAPASPPPTSGRSSSGTPVVSIDAITLDGDTYEVSFTAINLDADPAGDHLHFYFASSNPAVLLSGGADNYFDYAGATPYKQLTRAQVPPGTVLLCAAIAHADHSVEPFSGNCFPLP